MVMNLQLQVSSMAGIMDPFEANAKTEKETVVTDV